MKKTETTIAHEGRPSNGPVNRPVTRGSTVAFRSLDAFETEAANTDLRTASRYGRVGNPNSRDFEHAMAELEGGYGTVTACSGLAIISCALSAFASPGAHVLMVDTVYGPVRRFCEKRLRPLGVDIEYYDPMIGAGITKLLRQNTKIVYLESPGSKTFEIQDAPSIAAAVKDKGMITMLDNTWATPVFFQPLSHGIDISLHAITKYIGGHSDLFLGAAVCVAKEHYDVLRNYAIESGQCAGPDDLYMALRGLRTLDVRLRRHEENARKVINWLKSRSEIRRILYPMLDDCPGHEYWRRDFAGASGLFSVVLNTKSKDDLRKFVDGLEYFPIGYSWGGYESLIVPLHLGGERSATKFPEEGQGIRLHVGLENPDDLIADLAAGFERMKA